MISSLLLSCLLAASAPLLVSTEGLQGLVNMCIVDGRNSADFAAGHIPGAVHLDADTLSEIRDGIHGLLKPLDQLHQIVGDAGINPEKHVVIYSDMADPEKRVKATRVFWVLQYMGFTRLSLLDGGIGKWKAEGRALDAGTVQAPKAVLSGLVPRTELLADREEVKTMLR
ncbi:MAG: Thiosulfate sulfurtransferase [Candidatus Hydrogenedentes bacterium ADurb.Bin179]|nr:MAG: Thiosulfate sulfurtransferase [Candidatus Hydrogenedentes bacterium ADurb.Bin179]